MTKTHTKPSGRIALERDGALCWITFDNPARMNALNTAMWRALPEIVSEAEADETVRVVLLRGAGDRAFSAGADISEFATARTGDTAKTYDELNHAAFNAVMDCAKPTIAAVNGHCMGGGTELALCCDLRLASEGSSFAIPAAKLGIGYNARWIRPLLSALTPTRAKELLFTGRSFSHDEALAMGLINRVCAPDVLESEARALAEEIAANAPMAVLAAKRGIDELTRAPENPDLAALDALVDACFASD
ncbi:MAG: enoyl-CoA hydratase, partial [Hyphomicrobiales bacterium]|nr:enoyl-CoA hydratase [Hyphomicrobiales bacterium]